MQAYRCDRCKRFYDGPPERVNVVIRGEDGTSTVLDLCPRCNEELTNWVLMQPLRGRAKPTTVKKPELDPSLNGGFVFG